MHFLLKHQQSVWFKIREENEGERRGRGKITFFVQLYGKKRKGKK